MAFGITRSELDDWKKWVSRGEIAYLTHYWQDPRFPGVRTVTKVGCAHMPTLRAWCVANGLNPLYIHDRPPYPHFDLIGPKQVEILRREGLSHQVERFRLEG